MTISTFDYADYAIMAIIALSVIISLIRGFVREALSLATWAAAGWLAVKFSSPLANSLVFIKTASLRLPVAFGILFLLALIVGAIVNYLLSQLVDRTGLSGTDRMLGIAFGASRGILLVGLMLVLGNLTELPKTPLWKDSLLIPYFTPVEKWLDGFVPHQVNSQLITNTP